MSLEDEELRQAAEALLRIQSAPVGISRAMWRRVRVLADAVIRRGLAPAAPVDHPGQSDKQVDDLYPHAHGPEQLALRAARDLRAKLDQPHVAGLFRRRKGGFNLRGERAAIREGLIGFGLVEENGRDLTRLGRNVLALVDAEQPL